MKIKLSFNVIGLSIITTLIVTQIVFLILHFTGVIDWNIIFVILPIIVLLLYVLTVALICYIHYLVVTKDEREHNKSMKKIQKVLHTSSRNNVITPEILAMMVEENDCTEDLDNNGG